MGAELSISCSIARRCSLYSRWTIFGSSNDPIEELEVWFGSKFADGLMYLCCRLFLAEIRLRGSHSSSFSIKSKRWVLLLLSVVGLIGEETSISIELVE